MSRRRQLSDEEEALWAGFTRSIKPLKSAKPGAKTDLKSSATPSVASTPAPSQTRSHPVTPRETRLAPSPPLAPLGRRLKQRVARGREPIDARLDLHGMTQQAGARGAAAVSASSASQWRQDRARRHRQGPAQIIERRRTRCRQQTRRAQAAGANVARLAGIPPACRRLRRRPCRPWRRRRALCAPAAWQVGRAINHNHWNFIRRARIGQCRLRQRRTRSERQ